jgi:hypothetical protein
MERRRHPRVRCRLPVELYCPGANSGISCKVRDLSLAGLFAVGQPAVRADAPLEIRLRKGRDRVTLRARVARVTLDGVGVEFGALDTGQSDFLHEVMWPSWDGRDILEGVMILAGDGEIRDLAEWMRLTSVVQDFRRHRARQRLSVPAGRD